MGDLSTEGLPPHWWKVEDGYMGAPPISGLPRLDHTTRMSTCGTYQAQRSCIQAWLSNSICMEACRDDDLLR